MPDPTITREKMFDPLLAADPSFLPQWEEFLSDYSDLPELPLYLALADLAFHVIAKLKADDTSAFPAIFSVVETWHTTGDHYVRQAATIGFLETLLTDLRHLEATRKLAPAPLPPVTPWLGPQSLHWWAKLERFWDGDLSALNDET